MVQTIRTHHENVKIKNKFENYKWISNLLQFLSHFLKLSRITYSLNNLIVGLYVHKTQKSRNVDTEDMKNRYI